jgi:hypothetical protein
MARGPSIRIPSVAAGVKGADIADFARRVGAEPVYIDVTFSASTGVFARHGLRRRYVGGIVVGTSAAHASNIAVWLPESTEALGYDPAVYFAVNTNTAYTGTVKVWVF